ncbi:MAG TPA: hypothetical protein P5137_17395, partial [Candidatus Brocadiia bacterium]|nr:hypothetical protein [Candidatus Brocadiia bacterium]
MPGALPAPGPAQGPAAFAPPSAPPGPTPQQQAARLASQQAFRRNVERFGPLLVVLAALVVAAAALWVVSNVIYPDIEVRTFSMQPVKLRVGEVAWMPVLAGASGGPSRYYDVDPATIAVTPEGVASVERYGDQQIVVRGLSYGDATATMRAPGS